MENLKLFSKEGKNVLPALMQKLVGEFILNFGREIWLGIWREFHRIFSDPPNKGSNKFGENFGAIFMRNFVAQKNLSCQFRSADVPPQKNAI